MGISPDMPVPDKKPAEFTGFENDTIPKNNVPGPFQKDSVEYKNEDQLDREKVNEKVMEKLQSEPDKKPNKLKVLWNKIFGKTPKPVQYNYDDNPPPYDK